MAKIHKLEIYGLQSPISLEDYVIGTDGLSANKKTKNFKMRFIVDLVLAELGQPNSGIRLVALNAEADGDSFQSDWLKDATQIKSIITNNQTFSEFSAFPDFAIDQETGTVSGFPVSEGQELIVIYSTILIEEDEE